MSAGRSMELGGPDGQEPGGLAGRRRIQTDMDMAAAPRGAAQLEGHGHGEEEGDGDRDGHRTEDLVMHDGGDLTGEDWRHKRDCTSLTWISKSESWCVHWCIHLPAVRVVCVVGVGWGV